MFGLPIIVTGFLAQLACVENSFFDADDQVDQGLLVEETFQQAPLPRVDILWVVDNTASMAEEQAALADGFVEFVASLEEEALAYQVGVITADPEGVGGAVLQGDPWIITPELDDPVAAFAEAAAVGLQGTGQAGLAAVIAALSEPLSSEQNRGFRREDAALLVVVVSDDDDDSGALLEGDPVQVALDFLAEQEAERDQPARLSAIVGDEPNGCSGPRGGALPGTAYREVAEGSGGDAFSICDAELGGLVGALGELAVNWPDTFVLQATPKPQSVRVAVDGKRPEAGWTLETDPPAIAFEEPPGPGAWIVVSYELSTDSDP